MGAFLRTRRERLTPAEVGLPAAGRRRTAGLRREEVAVLAGIGASWLTRIEQGRAANVSDSVLDSLASALRLTETERRHLHSLRSAPPSVIHDDGEPDDALLRLVEAQDPQPAYLLDPVWNLRTWNRAEEQLFEVLADPSVIEANLLRLVLSRNELRSVMADWSSEVDRLAREFRLHLSDHPSPAGSELVRELEAAHPEFAGAWRSRDVATFESKVRTFQHPAYGRLRFDHHRFPVPDRPGWQLVIYVLDPTPGDATRWTKRAQARRPISRARTRRT